MMNKTHKILIIAFSFYPHKSVAALRMTRFAKYLPEYNIIPYIITAKQKDKSILTTINSERNFKIPSSNIKYIKSPFRIYFDSPVSAVKFNKRLNPFSYYFNYLLRLLKDVLLSPDKHILWSLKIIPYAYKLIKKQGINTVIITADPFSLFITGIIIKKFTKCKLILDYRDPWLSNVMSQAQTFYRKFYVKLLQQISLNTADFVIAVNQEIYDELDISSNKKTIIPNGYDPELFTDSEVVSKSSDFIFLYTGKLDIHSHRYNPIMMLKCFQNFRVIKPEYNNSKLIICGYITPATMNSIANKGLDTNVQLLGELSNQEAVNQGKKADALIHMVYPIKREVSMPMKIYEYIMLQKPVISINSTKGLVADVLHKTGAGFSCDNDDQKAIIKTMEKIFALDKLLYRSTLKKDPIKEYNVQILTVKLVKVINKI